jgi:hypothetical protein
MERWRTGRSLGRSIYAMPPDATAASKGDRFLGLMESPELAVLVVALYNDALETDRIYEVRRLAAEQRWKP